MLRLYSILFLACVLLPTAHSFSQGGTWTQRTVLSGTGRFWASGFSIGNNGYLLTGTSSNPFLGDVWEWQQAGNTWTQKASLPASARYAAAAFAIGTKGYVGT